MTKEEWCRTKRAKPGMDPGFVWFRVRSAAPGNGTPTSSGFLFGHWVTNARTLPEHGHARNARGVNVWWTKGELAAPEKESRGMFVKTYLALLRSLWTANNSRSCVWGSAAPTALRVRWTAHPALTGWARLCRASGARWKAHKDYSSGGRKCRRAEGSLAGCGKMLETISSGAEAQ